MAQLAICIYMLNLLINFHILLRISDMLLYPKNHIVCALAFNIIVIFIVKTVNGQSKTIVKIKGFQFPFWQKNSFFWL